VWLSHSSPVFWGWWCQELYCYAQNYGKPAVPKEEQVLIDRGLKPPPLELKKYRINENNLQQMEGSRAIIRTSLGDITIKFFPREAPQSCWNFISLVNKGFYRGVRFHLIEPVGAIVGGTGADGSTHAGYYIEDEVNEHKHLPGAVGMYRPPNLADPASCVFYICFKEVPVFDKVLTVFGQVVEGMEVVEKIAAVEVDEKGRPKQDVVITDISLQKASG